MNPIYNVYNFQLQGKVVTSQNLVPAKFVQDLNQNAESSYNIGNL